MTMLYVTNPGSVRCPRCEGEIEVEDVADLTQVVCHLCDLELDEDELEPSSDAWEDLCE